VKEKAGQGARQATQQKPHPCGLQIDRHVSSFSIAFFWMPCRLHWSNWGSPWATILPFFFWPLDDYHVSTIDNS
jgi:hypothetical protein